MRIEIKNRYNGSVLLSGEALNLVDLIDQFFAGLCLYDADFCGADLCGADFRDAEAYLIIAWDSAADIRILDIFPEAEPVSVPEFFARLMKIADRIEDMILPYEVVAE